MTCPKCGWKYTHWWIEYGIKWLSCWKCSHVWRAPREEGKR